MVPREVESDRQFILNLPQLQVQPESYLGAPISKLNEAAKTSQNDFYNEETYMDFHRLLCGLLDLFYKNLVVLEDIQNGKCKPEVLYDTLVLVTKLGNILMLMVKGAAIKKHLKLIADLLPNRALLMQPEKDGDKKEAEKETEATAEEDELKQLHADHQPRLKWQICNDWLELIIIYYDAVQNISHFIKSHHIFSVDIQIVSQPPPDWKMLPWKDLLRCKEYFPTQPSLSANQLIKCLDPGFTSTDKKPSPNTKKSRAIAESIKKPKGFTAEAIAASVAALSEFGVSEDGFACDINNIIDKMDCITNCNAPGSDLHTQSIVNNLRSLEHKSKTQHWDEVNEEIADIVQMLRNMRESAMLYEMLKPGEALSTGDGFGGTYHCESLLLAFCLTDTAKEWLRPVSHGLLPCSAQT